MDGSLIEYIFELSKEACLSDLHNRTVLKLYLDDIESIENDKFTVDAWTKAYEYFTGHHICAASIKEIKQALREWVE